MKHLILVYIGFIFLTACSTQPSVVEPENSMLLANNKIETQTFLVDSSKNEKEKSRKPENTRPSIFGDLIVKLNLSKEQKLTVEQLLLAHKSCTQECIKKLKIEERAILDNGKIQEDIINNKLNIGEISKETALRELRELRKTINQELKTVSAKLNVRECIKNCDDMFLVQLKPLLSREQLIILSKWQENKKRSKERN